MRRTYWKMVRRAITGSLGRFLAIFAIVALGAGFFAGLMSTAPDMRLAVDTYYDEAQMMDLQLVSTLGLTDADVAMVRSTEGVSAVMPAYSADVLTGEGERADVVTRLHSLPAEGEEALNRPVLVEGRMPQAAGECVAVQIPHGTPPAVGEILTLSRENRDLSDTLTVSDFTVVGIVESPWYFSIDKEYASIGTGTVGLILYLPKEAFCAAAYSALYVQVAGAASKTAYSAAYDNAVAAAADRLEALGDTLTARRYDEVVGEAQEALDAAQAEYAAQKADAEAQLADAAAQIAASARTLSDGQASLDAARTELDEQRRTLEQAEADYQEGQTQAAAGRAEYEEKSAQTRQSLDEQAAALSQSERELTAAEEQLAQSPPALEEAAAQIAALREQIAMREAAGQTDTAALREQLSTAQAAYEESAAVYAAQEGALTETRARLTAAQTALEDARRTAEEELAAAEEELVAAEQTLADTAAQIAAGRTALAEGERQWAQSRQELADGQAALDAAQADYDEAADTAARTLADGQAALDEAAADIAAIARPTLYVRTRADSITAYSGYDANCEKVSAIAAVFPLFFFLVAALVALTTMTRMVEEERGQIGVLRALGYGKGAVAVKYLLYAGIATLTGAAAGLYLGMQIFPRAIYRAYGIMYALPELVTPFHWKYALPVGLASLLCTALTTLAACANALRERPARLMLPKAPKAGKRVFLERLPLWRRLSFMHKVTARNLLRYKKRFFMTVIGVAGCTALLLTGFGLHDSIGGIVSKQYDELCHYDLQVILKTGTSRGEPAVSALLEGEAVRETLTLSQQSAEALHGEEQMTVYLCVPQETERADDFFTFRTRGNGQAQPLTDSGALLTEKAAKTLGVSEGDTVAVRLDDGRQADVPVGGVVENYLYSYLYLTPALYRDCFGGEASAQLVLVQTADAGGETLTAALLDTGEVAAVSAVSDLRATFDDLLASLDAIVVILIVCAGLLAVVVLYNLTNINITERQRELATLKVLGFYDGETAAYVYRENGVLTLIGMLLGLVLGIFLHRFVVSTAEVDMVMFERTIYPLSYLWAALLTLAFAALVDAVMTRRLRRIDMVESMKSGE